MNESVISSVRPQNSTMSTTLQAGTEALEGLRVFRIVLFALCTIASVLGNAVVCKAVREIPTRRSYSYYLVTNLAAAEIISSICLPFSYFYVEFHTWPFGEFVCVFLLPLQNVAMIVVTTTLAVIAVYRRLFLINSRRLIRSWFILAVTIVSIWFAALLLSSPLFLKAENFDNYCSFHRWPGYKMYSLVKFLLNFGVPSVVMLGSYGKVASEVRLLKMSRKRRRETQRPTTLELTSELEVTEDPGQRPNTQTENRPNNQNRDVMEDDLLRMINAIIIVFVICYLPYQVVFLMLHTGKKLPSRELFPSALVLTGVSGALNPLLYGTMNKFYAKAFSKLVMCRKWERYD